MGVMDDLLSGKDDSDDESGDLAALLAVTHKGAPHKTPPFPAPEFDIAQDRTPTRRTTVYFSGGVRDGLETLRRSSAERGAFGRRLSLSRIVDAAVALALEEYMAKGERSRIHRHLTETLVDLDL